MKGVGGFLQYSLLSNQHILKTHVLEIGKEKYKGQLCIWQKIFFCLSRIIVRGKTTYLGERKTLNSKIHLNGIFCTFEVALCTANYRECQKMADGQHFFPFNCLDENRMLFGVVFFIKIVFQTEIVRSRLPIQPTYVFIGPSPHCFRTRFLSQVF